MRRKGYATCIGEIKTAYEIRKGKLRRKKDRLGIPRCKQENVKLAGRECAVVGETGLN